MADDIPELDATDGAHPAWWRGYDYGSQQWRLMAEQTLIDAAGMLDVIKTEWEPECAWSAWDADVRQRITRLLEYLNGVAREKQATALTSAQERRDRPVEDDR